MQTKIVKLEDILSHQLDCVQLLVELAKKETEILKDNDIMELSEVCRQIGNSTSDLAELEERRAQIHEQLAAELNLPKSSKLGQVLTALKPITDENIFQKLDATASELKKIYKQLQEQNELNQLLIKQSIGWINALNEAVEPDSKFTYGKGGNLQQKSAPSTTINRTV